MRTTLLWVTSVSWNVSPVQTTLSSSSLSDPSATVLVTTGWSGCTGIPLNSHLSEYLLVWNTSRHLSVVSCRCSPRLGGLASFRWDQAPHRNIKVLTLMAQLCPENSLTDLLWRTEREAWSDFSGNLTGTPLTRLADPPSHRLCFWKVLTACGLLQSKKLML